MRDESAPGIPLNPAAGPRPWNWRLALSATIGLTLIVIGLTRIVPPFETVYRQIKIPLPTMTLVLLRLSAEVSDYVWLMTAGVALLAADLGDWTGRKAAIARVLIPLVTILMMGWMVVALFLPLVGTLEGIGHHRR